MIGRIARQTHKPYTKSILFEFNLIPGCEKPRGFYFGHEPRQCNRVARPEIDVHIERVTLPREARKLGSVHLTTIRGVNGSSIPRHPLANIREYAH